MRTYLELLQTSSVFDAEQIGKGIYSLKTGDIEIVLVMKTSRSAAGSTTTGTMHAASGPKQFSISGLYENKHLLRRLISPGTQNEALFASLRKAEILAEVFSKSEEEIAMFITFLCDGMKWDEAALAADALAV